MVARGNAARLRVLEAVAVGAAAVSVCYALAMGSAKRHYDVDEIQHAHVMWRIAMGDRPFHDFVESHPPFVWYLGAPVVRSSPGPEHALRVLRGLATVSGLVFVGLLLACIRASQPALPFPWLAAGALLVMCQRNTLDYFVEARPDSCAYCLLFAAFVLFLRHQPAGPLARYATFAFLAATALLWTPKFALLVVAFAAADLVLGWRSAREAGLALVGYAIGIALAFAGALLFLRAAGIDARLVYDLAIGFHARFLATTSYSHGLWRSITAQPVPLAFAGAGVLAWLALVATRRLRPAPFELAALAFLGLTPFVMDLPYKQYFAPWFALSAVFVPFLGLGLSPLGDQVARLAAVALLAFATFSGWQVGRDYAKVDQAGFFGLAWRLMRDVAVPEGRVVADPQWHPVFRRDVFYGWFSTFDPGGHGQERILREWNPRGYGARFTDDGYRDEIRRQPPALIVAVGDGFNLPPTQEAVVAQYVREHRGEYLSVPLAGKLALLVHRDQANWKYLKAAGHALRP
jgi:hypothetical protein